MSGRRRRGGAIEIADLEDLAGCPVRRYGHSATFVPDDALAPHGVGGLYIFGGAPSDISESGAAPSVPFYNKMCVVRVEEDDDPGKPSLNFRWSAEYTDRVSDAGESVGRNFHSTVFNPRDGCLYIFGGKSNGYRNDILTFNVGSKTFAVVRPRLPVDPDHDDPTVISRPPSPRWGHSAVLRPGQPSMLVFGGYDSNGFVHNSLYEFVFPDIDSATAGFWRRLLTEEMRAVPRRYLHSGLLVPLSASPHLEVVEEEGEGEVSGAEASVSVPQQRGRAQPQLVIVRGLEKTGVVLDDAWCVDVDRRTVRRVEISSVGRRGAPPSVASYGQQCFVVDGSLFSYGGRGQGSGDEIRQCFRLDLTYSGGDSDTVVGRIERVQFPFRKTALLSYGTVSVVGRNHLLFFGGQKRALAKVGKTRRRSPATTTTTTAAPPPPPAAASPPLPLPVPVVSLFRGQAAQLMHDCPEEVMLDLLAYLDPDSLCCVRAVSRLWSPSLVSIHDRLWAPIYDRERREEGVPAAVAAEAEKRVSMKGKLQVLMKYKLDLISLAEACFIEEEGRLDIEAMCKKFQRSEPPRPKSQDWDLKVFFIGNHGGGKTCHVWNLVRGDFPTEYIPMVFDTSTIKARMTKDFTAAVSVWDSAHGDYVPIRLKNYPGTDVVVIHYCCWDLDAFKRVKTRWITEVREHLPPDVVVVLCCSKVDLRTDPELLRQSKRPSRTDLKLISREEGVQMAKEIGASFFLESSAKSGEGMKTLRGVLCAAGLLHKYRKVGIVREKKSKCSVM